MSDGDDSVAMSIEDAFAQTLSDMEDAREELESSPVLSESSSLNSAFEVGVADVTEEPIEHSPVIAPTPIPPPVEVTPSLPPLDAPQGPPIGGPPAGPPMMGPPMGGPPAGPPMMGPPSGPPMGGPPAGPPMMGLPSGPPMGGPPAGPPMMGPPSGPPMDSPLEPPSIEPVDIESTFQVADLSEITTDIQSEVVQSTDLESTVEFDESVVVTESAEEEFETPEIPEEPEFNPVDADDFMSDFEDEWDNSAPVRASDVDRTEGMDW